MKRVNRRVNLIKQALRGEAMIHIFSNPSFSLFADDDGHVYSDNPYEGDYHKVTPDELDKLIASLEAIKQVRQQAAKWAALLFGAEMNQEEYYMMREDGCQEQAEVVSTFQDKTCLSRANGSIDELERLFFTSKQITVLDALN